MDLDTLKWNIISSMNESWSNLEKIRYAYIYAGKYLQKYTEFFLTMEGKMTYKPLSSKKLDKIYENKLKNDEQYKMICKSACSFLKSIYDEIGIESFLVETVDSDKIPGMKNDIHHYFLCVNDGTYNYFLTPTADFAYIQNGMQTRHFGTDISFLITGPGGEKVKYYKSDFEIPHKNLNNIEIKKIDSKIGYLTMHSDHDNPKDNKEKYIDEIIREANDLYTDYLSENTDFYNMVFPLDESKKSITSFIYASKEDWFNLINNICRMVGNRICEIIGKKYIFSNKIDNEKILNNWCIYMASLFNPKDYNPREIIYKNPNLLLQKTKSLCKSIINYYESDKKFETMKKDTLSFRNTFNRMIKEIGKHFLNEKNVREPKEQNDYVSSIYLNSKFSLLFPYMFGSNKEFKHAFNKLGFSEQIEIIKYMISLMFSELDDSVLLRKEDTPSKIKPLLRRINIYSVKAKDKDEYGCYFSINDADKSFGDNYTYWYSYDMKNNTFKKTTLTNIILNCSKNGKYELLSNRLRSYLNYLETAGEQESKKNKSF